MVPKDPKAEMEEIYGEQSALGKMIPQGKAIHLHEGYFYPHTTAFTEEEIGGNYLAEITRPLDIREGDRVLDIGCGVGATAIWLVEHRHCRVYGVDIVEAQIEKARAAVKQRGLEHAIELDCLDSVALSLETESFHHALALESACHIAEKFRLFPKIWRFLKPGGTFTLAEHVFYRPCPWWTATLYRLQYGSRFIIDSAQYPLLLREAGFHKVEMCDVTDQTMIPGLEKTNYYTIFYEVAREMYGNVLAAFIIRTSKMFVEPALRKRSCGLSFIWARK